MRSGRYACIAPFVRMNNVSPGYITGQNIRVDGGLTRAV